MVSVWVKKRIPVKIGEDAFLYGSKFVVIVTWGGRFVKGFFSEIQAAENVPHTLHQMVGKYINNTKCNKVKAFP